MGQLNNKIVAEFELLGRKVKVRQCWEELSAREIETVKTENEGELPDNTFYDFECEGNTLNLGEPWHDDGKGIPTKDDYINAHSIGGLSIEEALQEIEADFKSMGI